MSPRAKRSVIELSPQDPHWDREADCLDEDTAQFYVGSTISDDPKNITDRFCRECTVAEDCLTEAIIHGDTSAQIIAGTTRKERVQLVREYRRARREQSETVEDIAINLDGIVDAIAEQIEQLRSGDKQHLNNGNTVHDPRWQGKYSKRPSVDTDFLRQFWENHAATQ